MRAVMRLAAVLLTGAMLAGCASAPGPEAIVWTGGDPARLAADKAACETDSASVDINAPSGYSDPKYGTTAAMAAAINRDAPLTDQGAAIKRAVFAACMSDKGWKPK